MDKATQLDTLEGISLIDVVNRSKRTGLYLLSWAVCFGMVALWICLLFAVRPNGGTAVLVLILIAAVTAVICGSISWSLFQSYRTLFRENGIEQGSRFVGYEEITRMAVGQSVLYVVSRSGERITIVLKFYREPHNIEKLIRTRVGEMRKLPIK
jgi:ABC-type transport system involved in multi-copper enzyme maturation permease subunit